MSTLGRALVYTVSTVHLSGCALPVPTVSEAQRSRMGTVGVVSVSTLPQTELVAGTRGTGAGAAKGAAVGAIEASPALADAAVVCGVPGVGAFCLAYLLIFAGSVTHGAVIGGTQAVSEDKATEIEARLRSILAEVGKQGNLTAAVVVAAARAGVKGVTEIPPGMHALDEQGTHRREATDPQVDKILEVRLVSVAFVGRGGADPALVLRAGAIARLVDARTNTELFRGHAFTHVSAPRKFSEWAADGGELLKGELERAYASIGRLIVDEIFLVVRTN